MIALVLALALNCGSTATQMDLDQCSGNEATLAQTRETRAYAHAAAAHPAAEDRAQLRAAERAWTAYRKAACAFDGYLVRGGSIQPLVDNNCWASLTDERTYSLTLFSSMPAADAARPNDTSAREEATIYGKLETLLAPDERALLARSETAWLAYRSAVCSRASSDCATHLTQRRTAALKASWMGEPFW